MKKIIVLLLLFITFAIGADVKPFEFTNIPNDPTTQQDQYDYMLKYKLYGYEYFKMGGNNDIPDSSGWSGTAHNLTTTDQVELGGHILAGGSISVGNGNKLTTGPIRATTFSMNNDNTSIFAGTMCLENTNVEDKVRTVVARSGGTITDVCPDVPEAPVNLTIPTIKWPDTISQSINVGAREVKYIDIPAVESYDLYINSITTGSSGELYFRMRDGGTLTRIFVNGSINLSDHTKIKVVYKTDSTDYIVPQNKFRGNLLFYTNEDFKIENTDFTELQGTFITTKKATFVSNIEFAGQILANELDIGYNFSGKNFRFVKFDPDTIDVKLDKYGGLLENDSTVIIPVELNDTTDINVYFTYCIDLKDGVTVDDFNIPPQFPICGVDSNRVVIPIGSKVPSIPIEVNVKVDSIIENDTLSLRISDITGAILPNGKTDGELKVPIIDAQLKQNTSIVLDKSDTIKTYQEELRIPPGTGKVGEIKYTDDGLAPLVWSIEDTSGLFTIEDGVIKTKHVFDYETEDTVYVVKVKVVDGEFADSANYTIKITNIQEPITVSGKIEKVKENTDVGTIVGAIIGKDADSTDVTYSINDVVNFKIDPVLGVITTNTIFDFETKDKYPVTVTVTSTDGSKKDTTFIVNIIDVDEPVHAYDTTLTVKEGVTGIIGTVKGEDEDGKPVKFSCDDTVHYSIDSNTGVLRLVDPFDYETTKADTLKVVVTDSTFYDTATVVIRVLDEPEKVEITTWDDEKPKDTVKTNDPDHKFEWTLCEGDSCETNKEFPHIKKDTTIKVCNEKKTVCDSIVVIFNDTPPVVILTNAKSTDALIDYITIEEEKDDKIYVNKKENQIMVTVKDTVHKTEKHFDITVKLDTIPTKDIKVKEYNYLIDESLATSTTIGKGVIEMKEVIEVDGTKITLTQLVDKNGNRLDTVQTVTYTKKVNGKDVTVSYKVDNLTGQRITDYSVSYNIDSCTTVSYNLDDKKKIVKNKEGNIAYTISYDYTDEFGNKASASVEIVFDDIPPKLEILDPVHGQVYNTNAIPVKWTVNGETQDTLNLQRLEKGVNNVIRRYVDKAGNVAADTVMVIMKEAKDIDIELVHPVTMVDQDKVDEYYSNGHKYNDKKPYDVKFVDPKNDTIPDVIGIGFKVDIVLPSVSPTGSLATLDDITKNGQIPVDDNGNIVGASTHGIPVDQYVEEHCTEEFQKEYKKNGLNIPLYDVTYNLHLWVYTNNANYVNDFNIEFTLNDEAKTTSAGTVQMVIDWLSDRDGNVKAKNHHSLGTGAYLVRLYSTSIAKHRCDYKEQRKGDKTVKKAHDLKNFGYKRPIK